MKPTIRNSGFEFILGGVFLLGWIFSGLCFGNEPVVALTRLSPIASPGAVANSDRIVRVVAIRSNAAIPESVQVASRSVCRVRCPGRDGASYLGSGTYVGARTIVTAKHVVRDAIYTAATVEFGATRIASSGWLGNRQADQYLIQLKQAPPVPPVAFAERAPAMGEVVYIAGFGGGGFAVWAARLAEFGSAHSNRDSGFYRGQPARQGDSGGAVFNAQGQYVGTIWGAGSNDTAAVTYTQTRAFFRRAGLLGLIFGRRGYIEQQALSGCYGGTCPLPPADNQPSASYAPSPDYFNVPPSAAPPNGSGTSSGQGSWQPNTSQPPTSVQANLSLDYESIANTLAEKLRNDDRIRGPRGERGSDGNDGAAGPPGPPGELTESQISMMVATISGQLKKDKSLRGPAGPVGPAGDPATITPEQIEDIARLVSARMPVRNRRVLLVDGSTGNVIDDETYGPSEPIVLDVQRILNAAARSK